MAAMVSTRISLYRCMIFTALATSVFGTSLHSQEDPAEMKHPWETVGQRAACKGSNHGDNCEYTPSYGIEQNFLFEYFHASPLQKSIVEVLEERGFVIKEADSRLVIKSQAGKVLKTDFLSLPDIFDGKVTPNDFPVEVFLKETWKGMCYQWRDNPGQCMSSTRGLLVDACKYQEKGDDCTYASLQLERKQFPETGTYTFVGKCDSAAANQRSDLRWCKLTTLFEQQVEACLGKPAGRFCEYSRHGTVEDELYKGLCMGTMDGRSLQCKGVQAILTNACEGKVRGDNCFLKDSAKAKCGYKDAALQCIEGGAKPWPPAPEPAPAPQPEPEACSKLETDVKSMRDLLEKVAAKVLMPTKPTWPPTPPTTMKPPGATRRRRRRAKKA